jgi:Niemann-Pick C1 protein
MSSCSLAAVAILLQYLLQMTAFVALLTLDFRRTERASIDCLPCLTIERSDSENSQTGNRNLQNYLMTL